MLPTLRTFVLALALGATGCGNHNPVMAQSLPATALTVASHSSQLGVFTADTAGFDTHSFWYDTGHEVIVFDAQFTPALAQALIARIRQATRSPITTLVITHPNPDKFNGAPAFQAIGAKVVASAATAAAIPGVHAYKKAYFVNVAKTFTDATYPAQATVDVTFEHDLALPGGIQLHVLNHAGVATTQTVAYVPGARALVVGDLVHHQAHAWLEGGIVKGQTHMDVTSWLGALDELKAYRGATVFGGRGTSASVERAVADETTYLLKVRAITDDYIVALGARKSELAGPLAAGHQEAIANLIVAAFPNDLLPYMTHYSVYGLVAAELARL
jgi:glyoxylase-like metal-dependent hydrolase (beta-lactamase superfamily II)